MARTAVSVRLCEKLGHEESEDLALALDEVKTEMLVAAQDKFEGRLMVVAAELRQDMTRIEASLRQDMAKLEAGLRIAMAEGFSGIRKEMSEMRVAVVTWSFLFWLGQVVGIVSVLAYMLRGLPR